MKTSILTSLFLFIALSGFTQELKFEVRGKYTRPIHKEKLSNANTLGDVMPYYPSAWIDSYSSVEVSTVSNGTPMSAPGDNETLNEYQKDLLRTADLGSDVVINIIYKTDNAATRETMTRIIHYDLTIVPEIEATYLNSAEEMNAYLKKNTIDKISEETAKKLTPTIVGFTVTEEGKIADAIITKSSGDAGTDKLLLKAITKMPKWKPAQRTDGTKVSQEFEFVVYDGKKGC